MTGFIPNLAPLASSYLRRRALGATAVALLGLSLAQAAAAASLTMSLDFDRSVVKTGQSGQDIYALIRLKADKPKADASQDDVALNVALVLDQSGSMEEAGKLSYAKRAAKDFVSRLDQDDRVALVSFSSEVFLLARSDAPDVARLSRLIDGLEPTNATNISGGIDMGGRQVRADLLERGINRVILLSDGLANRGIVIEEDIARFARKWREQGVSVTAMGLGADYDEDFLATIATNGQGNYHFIESPAQMARVFDQEIRSLQSTTAQDVELRFDINKKIVSEARYFSIDDEPLSKLADLGTFFGGEQRAFLIKLTLDDQNARDLDLGSVQLAYIDAQTGLRETQTLTLQIKTADDESALIVNQAIEEEVALMRANQIEQEALRLAREENNQAAADYMASALPKLEEAAPAAPGVFKKLQGLALQAEEYSTLDQQSDAEQKLYLKARQNAAVSASQGKGALDLLKEGDSGFMVERLQEALKSQLGAGSSTGGYSLEDMAPGEFDAKTAEAVRAFQRQQGLTDDGLAGPLTLEALGLR